MAIPKPSQAKQPILNYLARATAPVKLAVLIQEVGRHFNLTKEEMENRMPSGMGRLAANVNVAAKEMKASRVVRSPRFGHLEITANGREAIRGTVEPQQPAPVQETSSLLAQPGKEQEAPKPKAQPLGGEEPAKRRGRPRKKVDDLPTQPSQKEEMQELQTLALVSKETTAKPSGRPKKKVDRLPTQPISNKKASEPKEHPGHKKEADVSSAQPDRKKEAQDSPAQPATPIDDGRFVELTSQIVASYVAKTTIDMEHVPEFIKSTHAALAGLGQPESDKPATSQKPAVPIEQSVIGDYIICLEDGKKLKFLKKHLRDKYNMSPHEYRVKWGLSPDYPMVAPEYTKERSNLAKRLGLGRKPGAIQKRTA